MTKNIIKSNTYVISLLWLVLLAGCGDKVPRLARLAPGDVIVAFGDSLTYGTGAAASESYPAVLGELLGRPVVRAGVPGETTAGGLARLNDVIASHRPKLMIVCLGGNDMLRKVAESETRANLREILRTLQSRNIAALLVGVPRPALLTSAPPFYAQIAEEFNIPYEGEIVTDILYQPGEKADTIHPNAKGYRRMAQAIAALLKKAGAV
jgi:lysophospholipase L1-like esterase